MKRAGKLREAASHFERALELNPDNVVARINLNCNTNLLAGHHTSVPSVKSIEDYFGQSRNWNRVMEADGPFDEPTFCFELGRVFIRSTLYRQAALGFTRAMALDPDNSSARVYMPQLHILSGNPDQAL